MTINWDKVCSEREKDFSKLWERMDKDEEIYHLDEYTLKDSMSKLIPEAYSMTMPDAKIFANTVVADLKIADMTTYIEGKDRELPDTDASKIEKFLTDYYELADKDLANLGIGGGLHGAMSGQSPIRGWSYIKCFPFVYEDKFHTGIIPWDARYSSYESGIHGLNWMSTKTKRSKALIEAQYPGVKITGSSATVRDILTTDANIILIEGKEVKKIPHKFGFVPGIVEFNPHSAFMRDDDYMENEGESVFADVRDLYAILHQVASVLLTVTMRSFRYNIQVLSQDPDGANVDFDNSPLGEGNVFGMKMGEKMEPLMVQDLKRTVIYLLNLIETRLQRGTLPATDYGSVSAPMSAVAIKALGEARNKVLGPLMQMMSRARVRLNEIICLMWNMSTFEHEDIMAPSPGLLDKKFRMRVEMQYVSPLENIANYTIASEALNYLPIEEVLDKILHVKDPQDMVRRKKAEKANVLVPELELIDMVRALYKEGDEAKAAIVAGKIGMSMQQAMATGGGGIDANKVYQSDFNKMEQSRSNLMNMFGGGRAAPGAKSSQQESADMSRQQEVGVGM